MTHTSETHHAIAALFYKDNAAQHTAIIDLRPAMAHEIDRWFERATP
ncbi:hypothetical protein Gbfr_042_124 [Gluconobacter frateurii M-2]|nr:hypothetical protein Gbfr_042_124 [Gluconobacter frateurii M-2]